MRVVVVVGGVLDPGGIVVNRRRGRIFVNREEYVVQPADRCALEAALRLRDGGGVELVALPRGPLQQDDVLRQALACGADRAVLLGGAGFAGADEAVAAGVLAAAVERLGGADLLLTGATTLDTGQAQLGGRLAEALGWPLVVEAWAVRTISGCVEAICPGGEGYVILEADLPAVVTVAPGSLRVRYPDGARLINVYRDDGAVERWEAGDLVGAEVLVPLLVKRGQDFPAERERGVRLEGTPAEMARALADALRQRVHG